MERWNTIAEAQDFEVSDLGNVRRKLMRGVDGRRLPAKSVAITPDSDGYARVGLSSGSRRLTRKVAVLVLRAFVGEAPANHQSCHENGDRLDSRLNNLRWDTSLGNASDKRRHGTNGEGPRDVELAKLCCDMRANGVSVKDIASKISMHRTTITRYTYAVDR